MQLTIMWRKPESRDEEDTGIPLTPDDYFPDVFDLDINTVVAHYSSKVCKDWSVIEMENGSSYVFNITTEQLREVLRNAQENNFLFLKQN